MSMDWEPRRKNQEPDGAGPVGLIAAIVVVALIISFIAQNRQTVNVHFPGFSVETAAWLLIVVALVLGWLLSFIVVRVLRGRRER
jgi:uncharacterized integral membrane protein